MKLKHLMEINRKDETLSVLFAIDDPSLKKQGFARKLISNGLIIGDIELYSTDNIIDILSILQFNISTIDDLFILYYSGLSNESYLHVTENLQRIINRCHRENIPIVLITMPTPRFIKKYDSNERKDAIIRAEKINKWILECNADYIIDISRMNDDVFFTKNGEQLSRQGNVEIYKQLIRILNEYDATINVEDEDKKIDDELREFQTSKIINSLDDLQIALNTLGYKISYSEISKEIFGKTTKNAIRKFKRDIGISPYDSKLSKDVLIAIVNELNILNQESEFNSLQNGKVIYTDTDKAADIQLTIDYLTESGITNPYAQIGILSVIGKESGFVPQDENGYSNTPNSRIRKIFGDRVPADDDELDVLKANDEAFFNRVYGGMFGNAPDEGYLYRGRGLNGLTFKGNYEDYGNMIGEDLVSDPERVNDMEIALKVAVKFFTKGKSPKTIPDFTDVNSAVSYFVNLNAGGRGTQENHGNALSWSKKFRIDFK
jgi:putative chitinase